MSDEKITVDDVVVLGNAAPDEMRDSRVSVCTAGFSPTRGLLRIYPVPPISNMKRWNIVQVPLERNPGDQRKESWKIQGSKSEWDRLDGKISVKGVLESRKDRIKLVHDLQRSFGVGCVEDLNDAKLSLGMVKPKVIEWELADRDEIDESVQTTLGGVGFLTKKNYPYKPMVTYRCPECRLAKPHHKQIVEWGLYEWMRQNPGSEGKVFENLHLGEDGYDFTFLVGNMARRLASFMVISVFRFKTD